MSCERVCRLSVSDIIIVSLSAAQLQSDSGGRNGESGKTIQAETAKNKKRKKRFGNRKSNSAAGREQARAERGSQGEKKLNKNN